MQQKIFHLSKHNIELKFNILFLPHSLTLLSLRLLWPCGWSWLLWTDTTLEFRAENHPKAGSGLSSPSGTTSTPHLPPKVPSPKASSSHGRREDFPPVSPFLEEFLSWFCLKITGGCALTKKMPEIWIPIRDAALQTNPVLKSCTHWKLFRAGTWINSLEWFSRRSSHPEPPREIWEPPGQGHWDQQHHKTCRENLQKPQGKALRGGGDEKWGWGNLQQQYPHQSPAGKCK